MTARRARLLHIIIPALFGAAAMALWIATAAAEPGPVVVDASTLPDVEGGIARWWQSGALAGPITAVAALLLVALERLSETRWPGLSWLRWGSTRAYLSMATGAVFGLLPAVADGSVTWSGFAVALLGGLVAFRPGRGEVKPTEEPPT